MKRKLVSLFVTIGLVTASAPSGNAALLAGTKCPKAGATKVVSAKKHTCIKLGKKLYWDNGTMIQKPSQNPTTKPSIAVPVQPKANFGYGATVPNTITSITTAWSDEDLILKFDWDSTNLGNTYLEMFIVTLTADGIGKDVGFLIPNLQAKQEITVAQEMNKAKFGIMRTNFTAICISTRDKWFNLSPPTCAEKISGYILNLPAPVISVSPEAIGYKVTYTTPTSGVFDAIQIVEYVSSSSSEPKGVDYSATFWGKNNPANVIVYNTNPRWVKARFSSKTGIWSEYSAASFVTPINPVRVG